MNVLLYLILLLYKINFVFSFLIVFYDCLCLFYLCSSARNDRTAVRIKIMWNVQQIKPFVCANSATECLRNTSKGRKTFLFYSYCHIQINSCNSQTCCSTSPKLKPLPETRHFETRVLHSARPPSKVR